LWFWLYHLCLAPSKAASSAPKTPKKIRVEGCRAVLRWQLAVKTSKNPKEILCRYFQGVLRSIGGKKPHKT
jgi:hypothetical protein